METFRITGLVPATFTAINKNGDVELGGIEQYCRFLQEQGIESVFVNGTTGEGVSLTLDEREAIAAEWVKAAKGKISKVIMHVGCVNLKDTQRLAKHAAETGVDAIAVLPPFFFRPTTVDILVEYCRQVASVAPEVPLYYYHIPIITGVELSMEEFLLKSKTEIPSLRGIKFSSKDLVEASLCVQTTDAQGQKYNILFGCDEQLIGALVLGVDGAVGSTYNFMPGVYQRMMEAMSRGDMETARAEQYRSQAAVKIICKYAQGTGSAISPLKQAMKLAGIDFGPPRCPMRMMDTESENEMREELKSIGFFEWYRK